MRSNAERPLRIFSVAAALYLNSRKEGYGCVLFGDSAMKR